MIYLDNAATSGRKPPEVIAAVSGALKRYNANPGRSGHTASMETAYKIYDIRSSAANFFMFKRNRITHIDCQFSGFLVHFSNADIKDKSARNLIAEVNSQMLAVKAEADIAVIKVDKIVVVLIDEIQSA